MSVLALGVSYRRAPVELLERLSFVDDEYPKAYRLLEELAEVQEAVILSTCNRVEIFAEVSSYHAGFLALKRFLSESRQVPAEEFAEPLYSHYEDDAAEHLFSVASGIDSMVLGEPDPHPGSGVVSPGRGRGFHGIDAVESVPRGHPHRPKGSGRDRHRGLPGDTRRSWNDPRGERARRAGRPVGRGRRSGWHGFPGGEAPPAARGRPAASGQPEPGPGAPARRSSGRGAPRPRLVGGSPHPGRPGGDVHGGVGHSDRSRRGRG